MRLFPKFPSFTFASGLLLAALITGAPLGAQTIVPSTPGADAATAAVPPSSHGADVLGSETKVKTLAFLHWGPLGLRPQANYSLMFETGLQLAPGHPVSTYIQTTTAGVSLDLGDNWQASYVPSWVRYSHRGFTDSFDQNLALAGHVAHDNWAGELTEQYTKVNSPLVDTGRQTGQQSTTTVGTLDWFLGRDVGLQLIGQQKFTFVEKLADTFDWSVAPQVTYQPWKRLTIATGATLGYVMVYDAPDMMYERPTGHVTWQLTSKTALDAAVGADHWKFLGGPGASLGGLYYQVGAQYAPFAATVFSLSLQRANSAGPFRAQMSRTQGTSVALDQRLLGHLHLNLGVDQQRTIYVADTPDAAQARGDKLMTYTAKLSLNVLRRGAISVVYRLSKNASSSHGFGFSIREIGIELGVHY
ncbi:MAG TPA: hypothetical protein VHE61_10160 [Opitutaceae bacterium]|nr:hypothetical protein [Opitutaceae bacterium]